MIGRSQRSCKLSGHVSATGVATATGCTSIASRARPINTSCGCLSVTRPACVSSKDAVTTCSGFGGSVVSPAKVSSCAAPCKLPSGCRMAFEPRGQTRRVGASGAAGRLCGGGEVCVEQAQGGGAALHIDHLHGVARKKPGGPKQTRLGMRQMMAYVLR